MITTDAVISVLYEHRHEKLALTVLVGILAGDSITEAWSRLDDVLPTLRKLDEGSRTGRGRKQQFEINHDIAHRVHAIAQEIEPWLRQLAERDTELVKA